MFLFLSCYLCEDTTMVHSFWCFFFTPEWFIQESLAPLKQNIKKWGVSQHLCCSWFVLTTYIFQIVICNVFATHILCNQTYFCYYWLIGYYCYYLLLIKRNGQILGCGQCSSGPSENWLQIILKSRSLLIHQNVANSKQRMCSWI